ncbi:MAG: winged helix DNA-binding domain-containing protein [Thermomicrobiales bacterium]
MPTVPSRPTRAPQSRQHGNPEAPVLDQRALNRATLARQHLIARTTMPVPEMIAHLGGLQAQAPLAPYYGLWSRLDPFSPDDLSAGILDRSLVRIVTMRGTIHLHTADDALTMRALTQDSTARKLGGAADYRTLMETIDLADLLAFARTELQREPRSMAVLRKDLARRWPDANPHIMTRAINYILPLVQVPPRGLWGQSGSPVLTTLEAWTGREIPSTPGLDGVILRYLAAFGPASVQDAQAWSGLTRLDAVFDRLRDRLVTFRNADGRELFDLPNAPRPDEDAPVPVRILAPFDNVLIGYKDRQRIMPPGRKHLIFTQNGLVRPTVLVDGFAAGIASITRQKDAAILIVDLFHDVSPGAREEIEAEGLRLLAFAEPTATTTLVDFGMHT